DPATLSFDDVVAQGLRHGVERKLSTDEPFDELEPTHCLLPLGANSAVGPANHVLVHFNSTRRTPFSSLIRTAMMGPPEPGGEHEAAGFHRACGQQRGGVAAGCACSEKSGNPQDWRALACG